MSVFYTRSRGITLAALGFACALAACEQESIDIVQPVDTALVTDAGEDGVTDVVDHGRADEVESHLDELGVDLSNFERVTVPYPDGTTEEKIRVGGDILFDVDEFERITADDAVSARQYRTNNLVSTPRTIRIIGYTGGDGYGLTSTARTALGWAVNNYNALKTGLTFSLSFSSSTNADMVVYRNPEESGAGGSAGFPSGGRPYKWVQLYAGLDRYNTNTQEHVITHEIGHSVGLRHTDYFSRQSCGQNTNEGSSGVGAVLIPGTPSGYDANSIMLACFGSNEDGEFGYYDRVALEYLY